MNNIMTDKNDNCVSNRQFERNLQIFDNFHNSNQKEINNRPKSDKKSSDEPIKKDVSCFTLPQKASLGYNPFINNVSNNSNKPVQLNNNFQSNFGTIQENTLPSNIYHNFATNTRLTKKENNYDVNSRNILHR